MAAPTPVTYSVPHGATCYGGKTKPKPAWVPAPGTFANISLNTFNSVRPAAWGAGSDISGPFANWCGGVYSKDYSTLGAITTHGSGDLTRGAVLWGGVWNFNLDTLLWEGSNVPAQALQDPSTSFPFGTAGSYFDLNGESNVAGSIGYTYPAHTYNGMVYQSKAMGGGPKGSLIRNWMPSVNNRPVHQFDLSSPSGVPVRVTDHTSSSGNTYAMAALDEARGGYWLMSYNGQGVLVFVKFADWSHTEYAISYNDYGDHALVYLPAPYDCLVGMGRTTSDVSAGFSVWVCPLVNGVPAGFTKVAPTGTFPPDGRAGGQWFKSLQKIVTYAGNGSNTVYKLTPPAPGSLTTGTWAWSSETLTGVSGATPAKNGGTQNGAYSRFIEVPAAGCAIWCDGVDQPVQAWRLTGM